MFQIKSTPFEDDIEKATNENNLSEDWSLIMQICDNAINYQDGEKFCFKAIIKRLHHNVPRVVMQALILLDACVKNCNRQFLLQIASSEFTTEVRKLLGKMHPSTANKLKELLQKWSLEEFKDDSELCIIPALYYKLKSEGVEFPPLEKEKKPVVSICTDPNAVTSQEEENDIIKAIEISMKDTGKYAVPTDQGISDFTTKTGATSLPELFKVRAIYDFDAAEENELTIKIGEIVLVLDNSDSNWWKGSNHRGEGLFPANFVTEDLDFKPEEPTIESSVAEVLSDTNESETVAINEKKIDDVLNWLNDVDPTEETNDPEDMLKLEKECHKMTPLIEENLQSIDNRLAMLSLVNEKIMEAFDLFHDLSSQCSTLPSNMKFYSSALPFPYAYQALPQTIPNVQQNHSIPPVNSQPNPPVPTTETMSATPTGSIDISEEKDSNITDTTQKQVTNMHASQAETVESYVVAPTTSFAMTVNGPPINQIIPPASVVNPYGANMMGSVFIPPTIPFNFHPSTQQGGFIPVPGPSQTYMGTSYPIQSMAPYIPYPYYCLNTTSTSAHPQSTVSTSSFNNQTPNVALTTATAVSNVLSETPVPSVSTDQILKPETVQNHFQQASGDGQNSISTSSSENS